MGGGGGGATVRFSEWMGGGGQFDRKLKVSEKDMGFICTSRACNLYAVSNVY